MRHPASPLNPHAAAWQARVRAAEMPAPTPSHRFLRQGTLLLNTHVDAIDLDNAAQRILTWGSRHQSRTVALCRMETLVQAQRHRPLQHTLAQADLSLPADAGVAWAMRREGQRRQQALPAHALMWRHLALAEQAGQAVHLHGDCASTLEPLLARIRSDFPRLQISHTLAPDSPQAAQSAPAAQDLALTHEIASSGAPVVFLGLDEAAQATWMNEHRDRVRAVLVGLGPGFGQTEPSPQANRTWRKQRRRLAFFARVCHHLILGAPPSAHDDMG